MQQLTYWLDVGLCIVGGLIAVGWLVTVIARRRDPLRGSPLRPNRLGPVAVWACLIAYLLGGAAGASLAKRSAPPGISEEARVLRETTLGANIGGACSIAACLMVASIAFRSGCRGFGLGRRSPLQDLLVAIPACLVSIAVTTGIAWVTQQVMMLAIPNFKPPEHSVFVILHDVAMPAYLRGLAFAGALLMAPLAEETLFRGILQTAVCRLVPPRYHSLRHRWIAIAAVGVLFGAMHSPVPQHIPALVIFGCILGYLYERTGSLVLPILVHMLFNGKSLAWDLFLR